MNIKIENNDGEIIKRLVVRRVFHCSGRTLMINRQNDGNWHLIVGSVLVPTLKNLERVEFRNRHGQYGVLALVHSDKTEHVFNAHIHYDTQSDHHIQFESDPFGDLVMYVSASMFQDTDWPAALVFTNEGPAL
jgi:hypothetical protein